MEKLTDTPFRQPPTKLPFPTSLPLNPSPLIHLRLRQRPIQPLSAAFSIPITSARSPSPHLQAPDYLGETVGRHDTQTTCKRAKESTLTYDTPTWSLERDFNKFEPRDKKRRQAFARELDDRIADDQDALSKNGL